MDSKSIVIFEDEKSQSIELEKIFNAEFKNTGVNVYTFKSIRESEKLFEERLKDDLYEAGLDENKIELFVVDRDLSMINGYKGFSEAAVSNVADEWAIPMCLYAKGQVDNETFKKRTDWSDFKIILDISKGTKEIGRESKIIWEGFQLIKSEYNKLKEKSKTPSEILAGILKKPYLNDRIALYGGGNQQMLVHILPFYQEGKIKDIQHHIPRLLGYWLWDSILRFPGIVVNTICAASYLNIDINDFEKKEIRKIFNQALYKGPFSDIQPLWWRDDLDEILAKENCKDGLDLTKKKKIQGVKGCKCYESEDHEAGYFCMVKKKPVCQKHSQSNISWFPAGADLARISTTIFEELAPWIGLY